MRKNRTVLPGFIAVLVLGLLGLVTGCGSGDQEAGGSTSTNADASEQALDAPQGEAAADARSAPKAPPETESGSSESSENRARTPVEQRSIIRTGSMDVRTKDPAAAADRAEGLIAGTDGFVANRTSTYESAGQDVESVQVVLRVPVERFGDTRESIADLGKVVSDQHNAEDVTEELVDVESRIASQESSIQRLRTLMGKAETVGEVIQVESELELREADLESLQSRQATLSSQSSLSTLTVTFEKPQKPEQSEPDPKDESGFLVGLRSGWNALVSTGTVVLTAVGAVLPFAGVLVLIGSPVAWYLRRARRRTTTTPPTPTPQPENS